jgi:hypothetical protein
VNENDRSIVSIVGPLEGGVACALAAGESEGMVRGDDVGCGEVDEAGWKDPISDGKDAN